MVRSFRDLRVWQLGVNLVEVIYRFTAELPVGERFGLAQQLRRAVVSIPSNLAEGHARGATRDFSRFVAIARGSLAEVETQLEVCLRLGYATQVQVAPVTALCDELGRTLTGLRKSLQIRLKDPISAP